jgi:YebC/PmpR family DNA-binding regulatory protein
VVGEFYLLLLDYPASLMYDKSSIRLTHLAEYWNISREKDFFSSHWRTRLGGEKILFARNPSFTEKSYDNELAHTLMSGHSHWAGIKQRKGVNDAKRANVFTKYGRIVTIAAREGGGDIETNFKLRIAVDQARSMNMPKENIERAIKRGTGELKDGTTIEENLYEGYGPGQVALLIKTATDNRNRTVSEIKTLLTKTGGKMVPSGSVSFMFRQVGEIVLDVEGNNKDDVEMQVIEAGADDLAFFEDNSLCAVYTKIEDLQATKEQLERAGFTIKDAGLAYIPTQKTTLSEQEQAQYKNLLEKLEDHDDVQAVYDNL